eukprot:TRINITY_DN559_c0_g1_i3.p2 TRINITY_DN559_c0_g1~~TRINITY_DN559_c0_g1_i3.p2  ORF type:complete len:190 (-),score=74.55 TRINITY_DN559_c0_g1_i3:59-628(-)
MLWTIQINREDLSELQKIKGQEKKQEIIQKQEEYRSIKQQHNKYEQEMKQIKDEKNEFQNFLGETYINQAKEQKQKALAEKQRELEKEIRKLEENKRLIEEERKRKIQEKIKKKLEEEEILRQKAEASQYDKEIYQLQRKEHINNMELNALQEIQREKEYKKLFTDFEANHNLRQKVHSETVLLSLIHI